MPRITGKGISVAKLIDLYGDLHGGPVGTLELLAYHLKQGNIRARAKLMWVASESSLRKAWKCMPDKEVYFSEGKLSSRHDIPVITWKKSVDFQKDMGLWQIRRGQFFITTKKQPLRRIMIWKLRLHSKDSRDLFGEKKKADHKSRYRNREPLRAFWHEVIALIQNGNRDFGLLGTADYATEEAFLKNIQVKLAERDEELARQLSDRLPVELSDYILTEEIAALRKRFNLGGPNRGTEGLSVL